MRQDQDMHTLTNNRPFFSIVIPCYNSRNTIGRTLDSILNQHLGYNDIQVILADDCSTESYQDIVDKYKSQLFITQVKTQYNYCPGNTRQCGVNAAIGEWVSFMDHDDQLLEDSYKKIKAHLQSPQGQEMDIHIFTTPFYKRVEKNLIEMPINAGWTHGKFFNLDKFWNKYHIHYIKNLVSHEDVSISSMLEFVKQAYNENFYVINVPTYVWNYREDSLSNRKYIKEKKERIFIDAFLIDYMESTAGVFYSAYKSTGLKKDFIANKIKQVLLFSYFYFQYGRFETPDYLIENCDHIRKYILILQNQFDCSMEDIYKFFRETNPQDYTRIWEVAKGQIAPFLFDKSFLQWLKWIYNQEYLKA